MARGFARTTNFKDKSIINDEIALIVVMDLMAMGEFGGVLQSMYRSNRHLIGAIIDIVRQ